MQLIAMATMLIDHVGIVFFDNNPVLRMIGRIAFPIYAFSIVLGYRRTRDVRRYMKRLLWIALASQIPFMLALGTLGVNAVGTLLVGLCVLYGIDHWRKIVWIPAAFAAAPVMEALNFDYGAYGLALILIYAYLRSQYMVFVHFVLNLLFIELKGWVLELFSIIPTIFIAYYPHSYMRLERWRMPKWLWRSFYPAHLAVLAVVVLVRSHFAFGFS